MLDEAGVKGGFIVHLGCGDGKLTAALRGNESTLVQGLDASDANVTAARNYLQSLNVYGPVSVERWSGPKLPYADSLVNLLVVTGEWPLAKDELMRVLAPHGVAFIGGKKTVKPADGSIDDWSHYLHDASGNAVAHDKQVAPPKRLRWIAEPMWSRSHEFTPSINSMVTASGRMFYLMDEGMLGLTDLRFPERWSLIARDAFSSVLLWKKPVTNWGYREWNTRGMWSAPLTLNRRVVTDGARVYVTLGYSAPLTALDAATGATLYTVKESTGTDEILLSDGTLVLCVPSKLSVAKEPAAGGAGGNKKKAQKAPKKLNPHEWTIDAPGPAVVMGVEAATGKVLWRREPSMVGVLSLVADKSRVCFHDLKGLVCLDLKTGKQQWRAEEPPFNGNRHAVGTLVMHEGILLFAGGNGLCAYGLDKGNSLWRAPKVSGPAATQPPDVFVASGLVWGGDEPGEHSRERTAVKRVGRDPQTGKAVRTIEVSSLISPEHHFRCYRTKATDDFIMMTKRGVEFLDLNGSDSMRNDWLRAMCHYGFMPANGLLYMTPSHCFCYPGVKMSGFMALAGNDFDLASGVTTPIVVEKGPAFERPLKASEANPAAAWPTFRHDSARSGSSKAAVPANVSVTWQAKLRGKLSQPVAAGGRIFVVERNNQAVRALEEKDGSVAWTFSPGGRVDSPPSIYRGLVLFGCQDGYIYCVDAQDGALRWRQRVGPTERRIIAYDQVASCWPVIGSVLVWDGIVYAAAGHNSFLDGGVYLVGIDPVSGSVVHKNHIASQPPDVNKDKGRPFDMDGLKNDVLVTDGKVLYLFQMVFDKTLKDLTPPRNSTLGDRLMGEHLSATGGFLEDFWYDRTYMMHANRWPGYYFSYSAPKSGKMVVFDEAKTYALNVFNERLRLSPAFSAGGLGYELAADNNSNEPVLADNALDREKGPGYSRKGPSLWTQNVGLRAQGMVLAGDRLFLAGPPDIIKADDPYASFEGRCGVQLWTLSTKDGKKVAQTDLPALPIYDGLIAANGKLFMSTMDGRVVCLEGKK